MAARHQPRRVIDQVLAPRAWPSRPILAFGLILLAVAALLMAHRTAAPPQPPDRLALDTLMECRTAYLAMRLRGGLAHRDLAPSRRKVLDDLYSVAIKTRSPGAVRRLVLMRYALGDASWKQDLALLWHTSEAASPFNVERELALWRQILGGYPADPREEAALVRQVRRLNLGWFQHLALAALYTNSRKPAEAAKEEEAALRSALAMQTCLSAMALAAVFGAALGATVAVSFLRRPRPRWLTPMPVEAISLQQQRILQTIFGSYLAAYLLLQIVLSQAALPLAGAHPGVRISVALLLTFVWALVPYDVYRSWGRAAGITPALIGWRTQNLAADVLFGVGGYMVALPLVALATAVSSWVFRAFESPVHPALMQFAESRSAWVHLLLFLQAGAVAPVFEETLFRGVLYRGLSSRIGVAGAVACTSAVFAALHPQLPLGFLGIFILGAVFNGLAVLRGSLVPAIVAHALNNTMILLLFGVILGS